MRSVIPSICSKRTRPFATSVNEVSIIVVTYDFALQPRLPVMMSDKGV